MLLPCLPSKKYRPSEKRILKWAQAFVSKTFLLKLRPFSLIMKQLNSKFSSQKRKLGEIKRQVRSMAEFVSIVELFQSVEIKQNACGISFQQLAVNSSCCWSWWLQFARKKLNL